MLPEGTVCVAHCSVGIRGFVVVLPDGHKIASAGNASQAWAKALHLYKRQCHAEGLAGPSAG